MNRRNSQTNSVLTTDNWELATVEGLECSVLFNQYESEASAEDKSRRRHIRPLMLTQKAIEVNQ